MGDKSGLSKENDYLLMEKIQDLDQAIKYRSIIDEYFELALIHGPKTRHRVKVITRTLEHLWVEQAGENMTFQVFKDFATFEKFLFQSEDYRGHYVHQFNVFLLGYYILNTVERIFPLFKRNFTWMLTATFHDMGYPIQQLDDWFSRFLNMFLKVKTQYQIELEKILTPLFFKYAEYISKLHSTERSQSKYYVDFSDSPHLNTDWKFHNILLTKLRSKDHGVISALLLMHCFLTQEDFDRYSKEGSEWMLDVFPKCFLPACYAISVHNLILDKEIKNFNISLRKNPYAFLLALCDNLTDWGRSIRTKDSSDLLDVKITRTHSRTPVVNCLLRISNEDQLRTRKFEELNTLTERLSSDNLMEVIIRDKTSGKYWKIRHTPKSKKHAI